VIALVRWTGAILLFLLLAMIALPLPAQADDLEFETYSIPVRTVGDDGGHTINELTIRCFRNGCVTQEPGGEGEPITDLQLTETDLQSTGRYKSTWSLDGDRIVWTFSPTVVRGSLGDLDGATTSDTVWEGTVSPTLWKRIIGKWGLSLDTPSVLSSLKKVGDVTARDAGLAGMASVLLGFMLIAPAKLLSQSAEALFERAEKRRKRRTPRKDQRTPRKATAPAAALAVGLAAVMSGFVDPRFGVNLGSLRTLASISVGFFFEVAVGWLLVAWLVKRAVPDATRSYDVKWLSLLIVIATVLFSRLTAFEPGIVFGLVAGLSFSNLRGKHDEARKEAVHLGYGLALGLAAWIGFSLLGDQTGKPFGLFVAECLAALTVGGIASLPIVLLPLGKGAGRKILDWNRAAWGAGYVISLFAFFLVVMPMPQSWTNVDGPLAVWAGVYLGYLALGLLLWFLLVHEPKAGSKPTTPTDNVTG
jgi:hypothetical protein